VKSDSAWCAAAKPAWCAAAKSGQRGLDVNIRPTLPPAG
jgi:hypothetical protein